MTHKILGKNMKIVVRNRKIVGRKIGAERI